MEEKKIKGTIISAVDKTKIRRLQGEDVKPQQELKILLDEISDNDFARLMFTDKISIILEEKD